MVVLNNPEHDASRPSAALQEPRGEAVDRILQAALSEDCGTGDVTTEAAIPAARRARGRLLAKEGGIAAGLGVFLRVFELLDPSVEWAPGPPQASGESFGDGRPFVAGDVLGFVSGSARALLTGERTALNIVQRLSGIATMTHAFVERAAGRARVLDTRKTTPGLRLLEKYAVRCGGGDNHRFGLFDEAMVKNNHLDLGGMPARELLLALRQSRGEDFVITAEARDEAEAFAAVEGDADVVLLDNMTPAALSELCPRLRAAARERRRPLEIEASGGVNLDTIAGFASSGVDRVSVGALTHSARALDLSFRLEVVA